VHHPHPQASQNDFQKIQKNPWRIQRQETEPNEKNKLEYSHDEIREIPSIQNCALKGFLSETLNDFI